jgi:hypothetical protein
LTLSFRFLARPNSPRSLGVITTSEISRISIGQHGSDLREAVCAMLKAHRFNGLSKAWL